MPWWSVTSTDSTPRQRVLAMGPMRRIEKVYVPQVKRIDAYHMASIDPLWTGIIERSLKGGHSSYFDMRLGLYDFVKNNPANMVEPFSSPWAGGFGPNPFMPPILPPSPPTFDGPQDAYDMANETRELNPPGADSGHHCFAVCIFGVRWGGSIPAMLAAGLGNWSELMVEEAADTYLDMEANNKGVACAKMASCSNYYADCRCCCWGEGQRGGSDLFR
jgi:hypothetical protein